MNLLPLIQRRKRKTFISPLAGTMLATEPFQSTLKNQISTLKHQITTPTSLGYYQLGTTRTEHKLKQSFIQTQTISERRLPLSASKGGLKLYKTIDNSLAASLESPTPSRRVPILNKDKFVPPFLFPKVEIVSLHLVTSHQDIKRFTLTLSLEQYFRLFFHQNISHNNQELNLILIKHIPLLREHHMLTQDIARSKWPSQFWQAKNTDELLCLLRPYTSKSLYWSKHILALLKLYCIPNNEVRATSLDNLVLLINKQLTHQLQVPPNQQDMQIVLPDGRVVQDFTDISFLTRKLYLVRKNEGLKSYQGFVEMERQFDEQSRKRGFQGRLRDHFRREIVPNKYDEESINYHADYPELIRFRQSSIEKATQLLSIKQKRSKHKMTALSCQLADSPARLRSKESICKEDNVQDSQVRLAIQNKAALSLNFNLGSKVEEKIKRQFQHYNQLSKVYDPNISDREIFLGILEQHHPLLSLLANNQFYASKLFSILEIVTESKIPEQHFNSTMSWHKFAQLQVLSSKSLRKLVSQPACYQILRNFVEKYLNVRDDDYFRDELSARLYRTIEGDQQSLAMMEEVVWSWLCENGFVRHEAVQRELMWNYPSRSKSFYLMVASMALGNFTTTPLDLAHELLL